MTEMVHVHVASVADGLRLGAPAPAPARRSCETSSTFRTFMVGATADNAPVPILGLVGGRRRALLITTSAKVVITSESGEASTTVGTSGGNGVQLPNSTTTGSPIELHTTSDVWAVSADGTPQTIAVIAEYTSE